MKKPHTQRPGKGVRPNKRLGQHFLLDPNTARHIVELAGFQSSDVVLEIGPGRGALTMPLAERVARVVAVEKDPHLSERLRESLARRGLEHVDVITQDILAWDLEQVPGQTAPIQVIGNLPYNISSPVLKKLVQNRRRVGKAVLMFQAEVAERLTASPGRKSYGALTVLIQYYARTTKMLDVPRRLFYPRPGVDSAVVELDFGKPYPRRALDEPTFEAVVRGAFAHRRKTILNSLRGWRPDWEREELVSRLEACGINPGMRAEVLGMEGFLCLGDAAALTNHMPNAT